jgi:hypothetical protein
MNSFCLNIRCEWRLRQCSKYHVLQRVKFNFFNMSFYRKFLYSKWRNNINFCPHCSYYFLFSITFESNLTFFLKIYLFVVYTLSFLSFLHWSTWFLILSSFIKFSLLPFLEFQYFSLNNPILFTHFSSFLSFSHFLSLGPFLL